MSDLMKLFNNELDMIIVDDFLSQDQIARFLSVLIDMPEWLPAKIPADQEHLFKDKEKPRHLFLSQYMLMVTEHDEPKYLARCAEYRAIWRRVTEACGFDLFQMLQLYFKTVLFADLDVAHLGDQAYFPIVVRDLAEKVLAHADYAPFDAKGWCIDHITRQIAWNIYLTDPGIGGDTIIYDAVWDKEDMIDENSYGVETFDKPVRERFEVKPGRLVLFNSTNFHEVTASTQPRIAAGGLIGQTAEGQCIAWG